MRAIIVNKFLESYDDLRVSHVDDPKRREDEVLIRIEAAGLNFVDLLYARGKHQNNRSLVTPPFILGLEFAGSILFAPSSCSFSVGERVFGGCQGSFAELISAKPSNIRRIPDSWSFRDAAGLAATAPVSYGALVTRGKLRRDETILIHAAAGGLGLMAVQIAKAIGARVIATASTKEKLLVAKRLGADDCVNYKDSNNWWKEVLDLTKGAGVDIVYDSVGLVDKSLKCLKHKGRILLIGFAGTEGAIEKIAMNRILLKQAQIIGYRYGESSRRYPEETKEIWKGVVLMVDKGSIQPTVYEREYNGLSQVPEMMNDLAARKIWGKAVVSIPPEHVMVEQRLGSLRFLKKTAEIIEEKRDTENAT